MNTPEGQNKHAWHDVPKAGPSKRPAAERVRDFKEIHEVFDEGHLQEQAGRCVECPEALCVQGCPLHNRIPEWMALAAQGNYIEAAAVSRSTSNMPEICSRLCPQERLCEGSCILSSKGAEPPPIGAIEKFINERAFATGAVHYARPVPNGMRVAVLGSGPSGMACADELAGRGFAVTIFESQAVPGGLLVNGIPGFKLQKEVVDRRFELLRERGVELRLETAAGRDVGLQELLDRFDAVYLGFGAQKPKALTLPGAGLPGVVQALPFLIQKNSGRDAGLPPIEVAGKRVAVLGGGDTAMDCLRTAVRCQAAEAFCLYRRDIHDMPASRKEYLAALEEGAQFQFLADPVAIVPGADGRVAAVRCVKTEPGPPDASGRAQARPVAGSEFEVPAEVVIAAFGFDPVPFPRTSDFSMIEVNARGQVIVDASQMTSVEGVFAGGDLATNDGLVAHAVYDARMAAQSIATWLARKSKRGASNAG